MPFTDGPATLFAGPSADMVDTPPGDISDASTPGSWPPPMNAPPVPDASSVQEKSPRLSSAKHDAAKLANPVPPGPETLPAYPASPPNLEVSPESAASPEGAGGDQAGASYAPPVEAPAQCQTVWEVLQKRPALQSWVKLLQVQPAGHGCCLQMELKELGAGLSRQVLTCRAM